MSALFLFSAFVWYYCPNSLYVCLIGGNQAAVCSVPPEQVTSGNGQVTCSLSSVCSEDTDENLGQDIKSRLSFFVLFFGVFWGFFFWMGGN